MILDRQFGKAEELWNSLNCWDKPRLNKVLAEQYKNWGQHSKAYRSSHNEWK